MFNTHLFNIDLFSFHLTAVLSCPLSYPVVYFSLAYFNLLVFIVLSHTLLLSDSLIASDCVLQFVEKSQIKSEYHQHTRPMTMVG